MRPAQWFQQSGMNTEMYKFILKIKFVDIVFHFFTFLYFLKKNWFWFYSQTFLNNPMSTMTSLKKQWLVWV